jgi:concentrative nucleoside transporter, CNT family
MLALQSLFGFMVILVVAWLCSERRRGIEWRIVISGVLLQFFLGLLLFKLPMVKQVFLALNTVVTVIEQATMAGTSFVFGYLGGADLPFEEPYPGAAYILAFRGLPILLVMSAISAVLFHLRILPWVVKGFSAMLKRTMRIGGALGVGASVNVFVGMVEAPLFVRPYLGEMTRSELFALMVSGMATVAGTMLVLYATILSPVLPDALGHILIASVISVPAAILVARLMVPEDRDPTAGEMTPPQETMGIMDAVTKGTMQGIQLLIPIVAMLVVLVALVALVNSVLGLFPDAAGAPLTLQRILGLIMAPVVWLMGVPWQEARTAGMLMGTKTILNEFIAYVDLTNLPPEALSDRSRLIMTYAMCGFANFGSLGILIGGLGTMAPGRRNEIVGLGLRSIVGGTLATCLTGAVVGVLY